MQSYTRVHCIGIGGIGVSAMAKLLRSQGVVVSGSDAVDSPLLKDLKSRDIKIWLGAKPQQMGRDLDLVIYSAAVPEEHEERVRARHLGVREVSYNAFLGEVSAGKKLIAVTGTHGKSTTTAMLGAILVEAGLDPTVVVGSQYEGFKAGNLQVGASDLFVAEACEHQAHMLHLDPSMIVLTNIEHDHPDFYPNVEAVRAAMKQFVLKLPKNGILVWNADDPESQKLVKEVREKRSDIDLTSYGMNGDLHAVSDYTPEGKEVHFLQGQQEISVLHMKLPGAYNIANAMMASIAALNLGAGSDDMRRAIEGFKGLWRRFEHLGHYKGADVYSDYAHHPTAVAALLEGAKGHFKERRVVFVFQPHQHARTRGLFDAFVSSMDHADMVILQEIYDVTGRNEVAADTSSQELVDAIQSRDAARGVQREVVFTNGFEALKEVLDVMVQEGDVVLMTGAGDMDAWARETLFV